MRNTSRAARKSNRQRNRRQQFAVGALVGALAPLLHMHPAAAQSYSWVGNGTNPYWDIASNWSPAAVPNGAAIDVTNATAYAIEFRTGTNTIDSFTANDLGAFSMTGGILNILSSFTTNGNFTITGGTLNVGSFTSTGTSTLALTGGTLNDTGILTTSSALMLNGATLANATVTNPNLLSFGTSQNSTLDNVTLAGTAGLTINGFSGSTPVYAHIADNFNFTSGATFNVGTNGSSDGYLLFDSTSGNGSPTFDNATVNLGSSSTNYSGYLGFGSGYASGSTLTLGSDLTVQGNGTLGWVYGTPTGGNLVNNGTINANIASVILTVFGAPNGNVTNNGTIEATVAGSTLNLTASGIGTFTNTGTIEAVTANSMLSLATDVTGTLINTGTILASGGGIVTLAGSVGTGGTLGSVTASGSNSIVIIGNSFTPGQASGVSVINGGSIYLAGQMTNTGNTFDIASIVGANGANGSFLLNGGTIIGGTIKNPTLLGIGYSTTSTLDNVTLANTSVLTLSGTISGVYSYLHIADSFAFTPGTTFNLGINGSANLLVDSTSSTPNPTFDNATINLGSGTYAGYFGFGNGYNSSKTLTLGSGLTVLGAGTVGAVYGSTIGANLTNNGTIDANLSGKYLSVSGPTNGNITNNGTIEATSGSNLFLTTQGTGTLINLGTIQATGGGSVLLGGNVIAAGTLGTVLASGSGSAVFLNGAYGGNQFGNVSTANGGIVYLNSGTVTGGTLPNPGVLSFTGSTSNKFDNVTLGGTSALTVSGVGSGGDAYLHIADSFSFTAGTLFNLGTTGKGSGYLFFDSTSGNTNPTFDNATINMGSGSYGGYLGFGNGYASGNTLTLGSGLIAQGRGGIGVILANPAGANLINNGTVNANSSGGTLAITGTTNGNVTNNGTLEATATGSSLTLSTTGTGSLINTGTIQAIGGSTITLSGNVITAGTLGTVRANGSGSIVYLNGSYGGNQFGSVSTASGGLIALNGGTIKGGTLANPGLLSFTTNTASLLDNVTLGGTVGLTVTGITAGTTGYVHIADSFSFASGAVFTIGTSTINFGDLVFDSTVGTPNPTFDNATVNMMGNSLIGFGSGYTSGNTLTLGSGLTVQGRGSIGTGYASPAGANLVNNGTINANIASSGIIITGTSNGTVTNTGMIEATTTSTLNITTSGTGSLINTGTIQAIGGGTVTLTGNVATAGTLGAIFSSGSGSIINLNGTYGGSQFGSVTTANSGLVVLNGGTITGGTIATPNVLSFSSNTASKLDNVTLGGTGGLNVSAITAGGNAYAHIADSFGFSAGATFNLGTSGIGNGYLLFDRTSANTNPSFDNATINLGNGSYGGYLGFGNNYASGNTLTLGSGLTVKGHGGIGDVANFDNPVGAILVNNGILNANVAGTSLAVSGSINANITNNGTIEATANGSTIALSILGTGTLTNNGTLLTTAKGKGTITGTSFSNTGTLQIDSGSTLGLSSTVSTQTGGKTVVNGALTISNSNANVFSLNGGALYGTGTIIGSLSNSGATVGAGLQGPTLASGTLALTGNYVQTSGGVFSAAIGGAVRGTQYDYFTVSGTTTLGGTLNIDLFNNFVPTVGETFTIIGDNGSTGSFSNVSGNQVTDDAGQYLFNIVYGGNNVTLTYEGLDATPEPDAAALLLLAGIPSALLLATRRRKPALSQVLPHK